MSGMQIDPQMLQALLGGQGGGGGMPMPQGPPPQDSGGGDWLTNLINDAHQAMVTETDPEIVHVLSDVLKALTKVQVQKAQAGGRS